MSSAIALTVLAITTALFTPTFYFKRECEMKENKLSCGPLTFWGYWHSAKLACSWSTSGPKDSR